MVLAEKQSHLTKAEHNKDFLENIIKGNELYNDWSATVIFYCAVHIVEAYFAEKNIHHLKHKDRQNDIRQESALSSIRVSYKILEDLSRTARYECITISNEQILKNKAHLLYLEKCMPK